MTQGHQGPGGEQRFPSATWVAEYDSRLLFKDRGKIEPKKIPSCLIPYQLVVCTWQLEIFSNAPMTILREAMTRYSHTGKPVEGIETRVRWERGNSTTRAPHIRWYKDTASTGEHCLWHLTLFYSLASRLPHLHCMHEKYCRVLRQYLSS